MKTLMVRYKVKAGKAEENRGLIEDVFAELSGADPGNVRYASFCLDDGVTFVHLARVEGDDNPLPGLDAFKRFQQGIADRCEEPPAVSELDEIGSYRVFNS